MEFPLSTGFMTIVMSPAGMTLRAWSGRPLLVSWDDVDFVSVTPSMVRGEDGWQPKSYGPPFDEIVAPLRSHGLVVLDVVLRDRRMVLSRARGLTWLLSRASIKPMYDAHDRPRPGTAILSIDIRTKQLSYPLGGLLDLLEACTRFDIVCYTD